MEWQPIETAPKNGSAILVYSPLGWYGPENYRGQQEWPKDVHIARWGCPMFYGMEARWIGQLVAVEDDGYGASEVENISLEPTHWTPLPSPPLDTAD